MPVIIQKYQSCLFSETAAPWDSTHTHTHMQKHTHANTDISDHLCKYFYSNLKGVRRAAPAPVHRSPDWQGNEKPRSGGAGAAEEARV